MCAAIFVMTLGSKHPSLMILNEKNLKNFFVCCRFHETCDIIDQFKEIKSMERETTLAEIISGTANTAADSVDRVMRDCVDTDISDKEVGPRDIKSLDTGAGVVNLRDMVVTSNKQSEDKGESGLNIRDKVVF